MNEEISILQNAVNSLAETKKYNALKDLIITMNPADIAILLENMPEQFVPLVFRLLPNELAADTFVEMDSDCQELLIKGFSDKELKAVVDELYVDDAVDLVEEMPANVVSRILQQADAQTRKEINEILKYPEDSAGSIMTTEFMELHPEMSVGEAVELIRNKGAECETVDVSYVTDDSRKLIGIVSLKKIVISKDDTKIEDIMDSNVISSGTLDDKESVAQLMGKYDFNAMPIVDKENRLAGIVTVDDAIDVFQEETTEDIEKMAAIAPSDKPYIKTNVFEIWKNRIIWLLLLMLSATLCELIIGKYSGLISSCVVLVGFIPMLMGTGGNAGSQTSVTIIRGISLNELTTDDIPKVILKETAVSLLCGITLAAFCFIKLYFIQRLSLEVSVLVCLTLVIDIWIAKVTGAALPLLAHKFKLDPAIMASPFITTVIDTLALLVYFAIAGQMIRI